MKTARITVAVVLLALVAERPAGAEGWRDWVPFANRQSDDKPAKRGTTITSGKRASRTDDGDGPSMLERMSSGTQRFFRSTVDLLTFKREVKTQPVSGQLKRQTRRKSPPKEEPGWFSGWFEEEEAPQPQTPQEFIGGDRPGFGHE